MTSKAELRSNSLQSWKEIATYLKRAVRTVQRWERSAGLPVRRPRVSERNSVFAFPEEKDGAQIFRWMEINKINSGQFTFPIDKKVAELLRK